MALTSVLQTAFSGMSAASLTVGVVSNNLANAATAGFKSSRASLTSQTPQTVDAGSGGSASIVGGAHEASDTDIGQNIVDLMLASQQLRTSAAVIKTADSLLDELTQLSRSDR